MKKVKEPIQIPADVTVSEFVNLDKLTPSERKVIENFCADKEVRKLLHIGISNGGYVMLYYDRIDTRKTKKHEPPYKYSVIAINKWGKQKYRKMGNVWSEEYRDIMDDFTTSYPHR